MRKSILGFGSIMMLILLVFSCTKEQEKNKLPDEVVNLKGEVKKEKQEGDERGTYNASHLLTYLHGYIKNAVSEDYRYYENMPERKEVNWFSENFERRFKSGSLNDNWILDKIESGEIFIFGTTVKDVKVAALIFSEDLALPEDFLGKSGFFFDADTDPDCEQWRFYGFGPGKGCFCHFIYSCVDWGGCWSCDDDDWENTNLEDLFDLDEWIINDFEFEKFGDLPVSKINIGDPVLQVKRKS